MAVLFYLPKVVSLPGSKLFFYQTGTSTAQEVYTDADLSVAHSQPVEADASGVFAPIYLDPTLPDYRVTHRTSTDVLIYTVDDVPSNQNVQQSMRLESTNPFVFLYDTDGTSGKRKYRIRAAGAAFEVQASNEAETVFTTILRYEDGILYSNETEVAVTTEGSFTGTLTGFETPPTGTVYYRKINNIVTLWTNNSISHGSNSTNMTMTGIPTLLRPSTTKTVQTACLMNNSAGDHCGYASVNSGGSIVFAISRTDTTANFVRNAVAGFTNSGGKGLEPGWTITYALD